MDVLTRMGDRSLGRIIHHLLLRDIRDMAAHARGRDKTAITIILKRFPIDRRPLLLLASPVQARGLGAVQGAVEVDLEQLVQLVGRGVEEGLVRPRDAGVRDEDVQAPVEFLHDLVDGRLHCFPCGHVDLVGFACFGETG